MNLKTNKNKLVECWDTSRNNLDTWKRIDSEHPIDIYIGVSNDGFDSLLIVSSSSPQTFKYGKYLKVDVRKRAQDKKWVTIISSTQINNREIFSELCSDLIESSRNTPSEKKGLKIISNRYAAWFLLFTNSHDILDESVLKGLIGELEFAKFMINRGFDIKDILSSWQGPDGADRDFVLYDSWFEIKSISTGKNFVTISSLNQFDVPNEGYLVIYRIDKSSESDSYAKSIKNYIDEFRNLISNESNLIEDFEKKLSKLGYRDSSEYEKIYFSVSDFSIYKVDDSFPKLTTRNVHNAVICAKYDLSIAALELWRTEVEKVWN